MKGDSMIEHGDRVKDKITGMSGIVVGITTWLYGCKRMSVQQETLEKGKPSDLFIFDEPQLTLLKKNVIKPIKEIVKSEPIHKHGPRENVMPKSSPNRY